MIKMHLSKLDKQEMIDALENPQILLGFIFSNPSDCYFPDLHKLGYPQEIGIGKCQVGTEQPL
jgi:hypothetical protein